MPNSKGKGKTTVSQKAKDKVECDCGEGGSQGKGDSVLAVVSLVVDPACLSLILLRPRWNSWTLFQSY